MRGPEPHSAPLVEGMASAGARVELRRHAQGARRRLEAGLRHVVGVVAGAARDVQRDQCVHGEGAEELLEQLGVHLADLGALEGHVPGQERAAGDVHRGLGQRLVHRHQGVAEAADAALVAQRLGEGLAEHDADILGGVVEVDVQVALRLHGQVEQAVAGERGQHVVEEADAGGNVRPSRPVERQGQADVGFRGCPLQACRAAHGRCT